MKEVENQHSWKHLGILNSLEDQLIRKDPPETKENYDRLISQGFSDQDARRMISIAIATESMMVLKHKEPFDRARFVATLRELPRSRL
ncbi:MAG: hypothetical protein HQL92_08375 [Magnetococcales bacterium]|nr:hypothetical protein [Magnetococcales bacterium]